MQSTITKRIISRRGIFALLFVLWATLVIGFTIALERHTLAPGDVGTTPSRLPTTWLDQTRPDGQRLLIFLHPHCPCSLASLQELEKLQHSAPANLQTEIWIVKPQDAEDDWLETAVVRAASKVAHTQLRIDEDARLAHQMGAQTSGHALLYDPQGNLRFSGGITRGRGQVGANPGAEILEATFLGKSKDLTCHPVYGCRLYAPDTSAAALP